MQQIYLNDYYYQFQKKSTFNLFELKELLYENSVINGQIRKEEFLHLIQEINYVFKEVLLLRSFSHLERCLPILN